MLRKAGVSVGAAAAAWTTVQRAHASERPPREVGIVSYNVLSSTLGDAKYYYTCKEEDMDVDTRFARVVAKIARQIEDGHGVICLQEVSQSWSGPLHTYFANRGFHFVFASYGSVLSNYMGNAIVYDTARYEAEKIEIQRVSDTYRGWLKVPRVQLSFLTKLYRLVFGNPPREFCPWNEAENRKNQLVLAKLRGREHGETFCVSNYHMPCLFGSAEKVQVMNIHAQLVSEKTHAFAAGSPFLMVGDWNFQPGTSPYQLITEGAIGEDDPERPVHPKGKWESKVPALRSAYKEHNGEEPLYTHYAETMMREGVMFQGTLDYIFMSSHWKVKSTLATGTELPDHTFPTETEPSDHVMIAAKLQL